MHGQLFIQIKKNIKLKITIKLQKRRELLSFFKLLIFYLEISKQLETVCFINLTEKQKTKHVIHSSCVMLSKWIFVVQAYCVLRDAKKLKFVCLVFLLVSLSVGGDRDMMSHFFFSLISTVLDEFPHFLNV
uniref:(northern house mosquito) hypothetical protein n=1 Tax=Culex pipiens TaxID=7175 RepID=A0A8D8GH97_CULPI